MVKGLVHVSVLTIDERFTILAYFGIGRIKIDQCTRSRGANHIVGISVVYIPIADVSTIVLKVGYVTHREVRHGCLLREPTRHKTRESTFIYHKECMCDIIQTRVSLVEVIYGYSKEEFSRGIE
jgi:hypothetical protein